MLPEFRGYRMNGIRIVLADDHKLFRDGVKKLLDQESDITIVGEASDGEEALAACSALARRARAVGCCG